MHALHIKSTPSVCRLAWFHVAYFFLYVLSYWACTCVCFPTPSPSYDIRPSQQWPWLIKAFCSATGLNVELQNVCVCVSRSRQQSQRSHLASLMRLPAVVSLLLAAFDAELCLGAEMGVWSSGEKKCTTGEYQPKNRQKMVEARRGGDREVTRKLESERM